MRTLQVFAVVSLGQLLWAADGGVVKLPPVLKNNEATDSVIVTLPGTSRVHTLPVPDPAPVPPPEKKIDC